MPTPPPELPADPPAATPAPPTAPAPAPEPLPALPAPRMQAAAAIASHILMAAALLLVMWRGLLPGLLCACLGFLSTRWLSPRMAVITRAPDRQSPRLAAALVALLPLAMLLLALPRTRGLILDAPGHYRELLDFMGRTVLDFRERLPPDIAAMLPDGSAEVQSVMAGYLASKASTLATTGRAWLSGLLFAYIGLLIGALAAARPSSAQRRPLAAQLHQRVRRFGETFRQIVVAQFWIALLNTCLTAIFLLLILPLTGNRLPYSMALLLLTFVAGLIPIVGNLICNAVLTLVGLSVSAGVAVACLAFLILIHKAEYFINAKVIGHRTHMGVWELLAVMFTMEALFGPAGLVAAPLFYAYAKKELEASGWV